MLFIYHSIIYHFSSTGILFSFSNDKSRKIFGIDSSWFRLLTIQYESDILQKHVSMDIFVKISWLYWSSVNTPLKLFLALPSDRDLFVKKISLKSTSIVSTFTDVWAQGIYERFLENTRTLYVESSLNTLLRSVKRFIYLFRRLSKITKEEVQLEIIGIIYSINCNSKA